MATLNIIDVETTGLIARTNRIIEIGLIQVKYGQVVERYQQLVNPLRPLSPFIQNHTGITPAMVSNAPVFADILPKLQTLLRSGVFVAHNADFDYSFIQSEYKRHGLVYHAPRLCTVRLSRKLFPFYQRHGLDQIIRRFKIDCPDRHRALDDAEVVWRFYQMVSQNFDSDLLLTY